MFLRSNTWSPLLLARPAHSPRKQCWSSPTQFHSRESREIVLFRRRSLPSSTTLFPLMLFPLRKTDLMDVFLVSPCNTSYMFPTKTILTSSMTCRDSEVRRQSERSSCKIESVEGRMEERALKTGREHPPADKDSTPPPGWALQKTLLFGGRKTDCWD